MNWDDLRFLQAIGRYRSLARAGRSLGVDATTVRRKIGTLERALGAPLVRRLAEGHVLTPAGEGLMPFIEQMELNAVMLERRARSAGMAVAGRVRVTAGDGLTNHVLVPALPRLRAQHPELRVDLISELRVLDLTRREADIALRLVRPSAPNLIARRIATLAYGIYASDRYLATRRPPATPDDLAAHDWIDYVQSARSVSAFRWLRRYVPAERIVLRATTTTTVVHACTAGLGLALLLTVLAESEPGLVRVLPETGFPTETFIAYHKDDRKSARVAAVGRWLQETLRER